MVRRKIKDGGEITMSTRPESTCQMFMSFLAEMFEEMEKIE